MSSDTDSNLTTATVELEDESIPSLAMPLGLDTSVIVFLKWVENGIIRHVGVLKINKRVEIDLIKN